MSEMRWERMDSGDWVIAVRLWVKVGESEQVKRQLERVVTSTGYEILSDAESW